MRPSCSAAENVTSLKTEPGSYSWVTAVLFAASLTASFGPIGMTPAGRARPPSAAVADTGAFGMRRDQIGHGEDLARLHVHEDGRPTEGLRRLDRLGQRLLRLVLELRIEGQLEPLAGLAGHLIVHRRLRAAPRRTATPISVSLPAVPASSRL